MSKFPPEQILNFDDKELVDKIINDEAFGQSLSDLTLEVYQDDTLADVRAALMGEAISGASVDCEWKTEWNEGDRDQHREKTYPLAFGKEVVDIRVRVLAKVRCAIKRAIPDTASLYFVGGTGKERLQAILTNTHDGDLAYKFKNEDLALGGLLAGEGTVRAIRSWNPNFSPELQVKLVKDYTLDPFDQDAHIVGILAEDGKLSLQAWNELLKRNDRVSQQAIMQTKDQRPEVLQLIQQIP
ncbi:MAG: hypothetical protein WCU83_12805 [Bacteroidia bacterium]|jgi:hypothetical protein